MLQSLRKEKKSQDSRNFENDRKGRNKHNQQRKKKSNDSRSRSRSNSQRKSHKPSTNKHIKMTKKNSEHQLKLQKKKGKKSYDFFHEIDRINKVKKKDFKRCKFKIMTKARTTIMANKMNILKLC